MNESKAAARPDSNEPENGSITPSAPTPKGIMPGTPHILLLDHRGERGDVLQLVLAGLGRIDMGDVAAGTLPDLVVIDPAEGMIPALPSRLRSVPVLVLGAEPPADVRLGRTYNGPVVPSRLRQMARRLLDERPPALAIESAPAAAALLPLSDRALALLARVAATRIPILLRGEPGSGRAMLARARLTPAGQRMRRVDPGVDGLRHTIDQLAPGATLFVAPLELATDDDHLALLDLLDDGDRDVRLVAGLSEPIERLHDELRVRLEAVTIELTPLRRQRDRLPALFRQLLAAQAEEHGVALPEADASVDDAVRAHPWPLNFEELLATARRALFAAPPGRPLTAAALELGRAPAPFETSERVEMVAAGRLASALEGPSPSDRSLDDLVQELAHEVKNPLVSIKTFTQLLGERFDDAEFRGDYYQVVARDVDRIDASLSHLADFARLRRPEISTVDVRDSVRAAIAAQEYLLRKRGLKLKTELPDAPLDIETDPELLAYALENDLRQALEVMDEGTELEVTADRPLTDASRPIIRVRLAYARATGAETDPGDSTPHVRRAVGLRHALAAHVVGLLGGRQRIEDTLDGQTSIVVELDG